MIAIKDIAWVAGLLEGEGSFLHKEGALQIYLGMTDEDIVKRARNILEPAKQVYTRIRFEFKTMYELYINGKLAAGWMMTLYPFMGIRRKSAIRQALSGWKEKPNRTNYTTDKFCKNGHPLTAKNLNIDNRGYFFCRKCRNKLQKRYR